MQVLIKNAIVVNHDKMSAKKQDVLIEKGVIAQIASHISCDAQKVIDVQGKFVLPGLIDVHCHLREPGREDKETIESGSRAAAKGGFTTIMCMPNTKPVIDNGPLVESVVKEAKRAGYANVIPIGAITKAHKDEELTDMFELKAAGCRALSDDGKSVLSAQMMRFAMEYAKMVDILLVEHCQDPTLSHGGVMNEGFNATLLGLKGDPGISETVIVSRDIEIAKYLNARLHLAHISLKRSVELIRAAKNQGVQITAEACPHHFSLTDESVKSYDPNLKVNPPLRTKEDVAAIKKAIKDGVIDCISTDHAPHTQEDKEVGFDQAPFGMIGFETALALTIDELVRTDIITWPQLVERMSAVPAQIMGLDSKGAIEEGKDADVVVVDPEKEWIFEKDGILSKSKNSPFLGRKFTGAAEVTILGGRIVYQSE